jgi:nitrate/nitrite transporter NarK
MRKDSVSIIIGGFLALCFLSILNTAYSTVLKLIKEEFKLSYTFSGALMSSYFIGYTLGQVPWGYLADRFGSRRIITLSILGISISTMFFGFSMSIWQAVSSRFLAGLLGAGIFVPIVKLVSNEFPPQRRGTALGLLSTGGSVGLITASWVSPLLALNLGWRFPITMLGMVGVLVSPLIWFMLRDRGVWEFAAKSGAEGVSFVGSLAFWVLAFIQFIRLGSTYAVIAWLPLLLKEERGLSLLSAGVALSIFNFAGMLSNPMGGLASDLVGEKKVISASFLLLTLNVLLFMRLRAPSLILITLFAMGWLINFIRSPSFAIIPKIYGAESTGRVSGIQNTFASLGALFLPLLLGYVRDITASYWMGWITISMLFFLASITMLTIQINSY